MSSLFLYCQNYLIILQIKLFIFFIKNVLTNNGRYGLIFPMIKSVVIKTLEGDMLIKISCSKKGIYDIETIDYLNDRIDIEVRDERGHKVLFSPVPLVTMPQVHTALNGLTAGRVKRDTWNPTT